MLRPVVSLGVSEQLLFLLKLCLLALLYLFFFRVLRAVWAEVRAPVGVMSVPAAATGAPKADRKALREAKKRDRKASLKLVTVDPPAMRGQAYTLGGEVTIGRAPGCQVAVEDAYVSQLHARVYTRDGRYMLEDLGSTNGTQLNKKRVGAPTVLQRGDRVQVGNTVFEVR